MPTRLETSVYVAHSRGKYTRKLDECRVGDFNCLCCIVFLCSAHLLACYFLAALLLRCCCFGNNKKLRVRYHFIQRRNKVLFCCFALSTKHEAEKLEPERFKRAKHALPLSLKHKHTHPRENINSICNNPASISIHTPASLKRPKQRRRKNKDEAG